MFLLLFFFILFSFTLSNFFSLFTYFRFFPFIALLYSVCRFSFSRLSVLMYSLRISLPTFLYIPLIFSYIPLISFFFPLLSESFTLLPVIFLPHFSNLFPLLVVLLFLFLFFLQILLIFFSLFAHVTFFLFFFSTLLSSLLVWFFLHGLSNFSSSFSFSFAFIFVSPLIRLITGQNFHHRVYFYARQEMCAPRRQNSELCRKKSRSLSCKHSCRATFHQRYLNFSSPASHTEPVSQTKPLVKHPTSHTESPVRQSASRTLPPDKHRVRRFSSQPVQQLH